MQTQQRRYNLTPGAQQIALSQDQSRFVMQVREKIEVEGREPRWEFSKTVLFERSAHISDVCGSLTAAIDTYHSLRQTLGTKLEAMTGSSQVLNPIV